MKNKTYQNHQVTLVPSTARCYWQARVLLAATLIAADTAFCAKVDAAPPISTWNAYIGLAKTFYTGVKGIFGSTKVTPACAMYIWDHWDYGIYGTHDDGKPFYWGTHSRAKRCLSTGEYTYKTWIRDSRTGAWKLLHEDTFDVPALRRMTWTCVPKPGHPVIYNKLEEFSMVAWPASVVKTGLFPPRPPYESYVKTRATSLPYNCTETPYTPVSYVVISDRINLGDYGAVYFRMPHCQREYEFPPFQWVGKRYDY